MVIRDDLVYRFLVAGVDQVQTHALQATMLELKRLGSTVRQVDNPAGNDRSAVIDPDHNGFAIAQVRDPHVASHGERQVSCRHVVHIVRLAARRGFTIENLAVPGRCPNLIRFRLDLWADFGSCLNGTNWSRYRLRDVRSLSRSQADDQESNRQSSSYKSSHSVLLAYSKVPWPLASVSLQFVDAIGVPNLCQWRFRGRTMPS